MPISEITDDADGNDVISRSELSIYLMRLKLFAFILPR